MKFISAYKRGNLKFRHKHEGLEMVEQMSYTYIKDLHLLRQHGFSSDMVIFYSTQVVFFPIWPALTCNQYDDFSLVQYIFPRMQWQKNWSIETGKLP